MNPLHVISLISDRQPGRPAPGMQLRALAKNLGLEISHYFGSGLT